MNDMDISRFANLSEDTTVKLSILNNHKDKLQKEYGNYYEVLEPKQKLDVESRKYDNVRVFKHLHHHCFLMSMNFNRGNYVKQISLLDFYLFSTVQKNPLAIYSATRTIIELTAFLNDISSRLETVFNKPEANWKGKGEEFFNIIVRARYGTYDSKFQDLLSTAGISSKKIKPINIMQSIENLKESGFMGLANSYGEMCEFVHHNLSSNTTANLGSKVYDHYGVINENIAVVPGNITTAYCYPIPEKGNKAIEGTVDIIGECFNLLEKTLEKIKLTPFSENQIKEVTGTTHGFTHLKPPKKKPITVEQKIGRNDPCPCGSGNKYKKCCRVLN